MRISDNRYQRDHMRLDLALRFLGHGARTHTIRAYRDALTLLFKWVLHVY